MPRHPTARNRRRSASNASRPHTSAPVDAAAALRSLIQDGIVAAAALAARDDLARAAESMARLGTLTSGMWRALSRELVTASERLDRQSAEHLDNVMRRARAVDVAPDAVLAAGAAAAHLDEHRAALDELLPTLSEDARRLAAPDVLFGFSVDLDDEASFDNLDADQPDPAAGGAPEPDEGLGVAIHVLLYVWAAPLNPVYVSIAAAPPKGEGEGAAEPELSVSVDAAPDDATIAALAAVCGLPREVLPVRCPRSRWPAGPRMKPTSTPATKLWMMPTTRRALAPDDLGRAGRA
jgi:hypothetical protein